MYKSREMQAGRGLKIFKYCCHFVKFMTYFCNRLAFFIHIFQINRVYDFTQTNDPETYSANIFFSCFLDFKNFSAGWQGIIHEQMCQLS